jgi:DNA polymerase III subunit delta'
MLIPAHLIVGSADHLTQYAHDLLQKQFCKNTDQNPLGCFCSECKKVKGHQHPLLVWITPEKDYTVDDIEIVFDKIRYQLDQSQRFYFVFDKAHTLTTTTANRLLKVLEEPPVGYHFLLLTTNLKSILPTIVSRCMVTDLGSGQQDSGLHPLFEYFFQPTRRNDPAGFADLLKKQAMNDTQATELAEQLMAHVTEKLRDSMLAGNNTEIEFYNRALQFMLKAMKRPPQSGSVDIFFKHLFMLFPQQ